MGIKDNLKTEAEKLQKMSFKKKLEHIWEYYKAALIGVLVLIVLLISIGDIIRKSQYEEILYVSVLNAEVMVDEIQKEKFLDGFLQYAKAEEKETVTIDYSMEMYEGDTGAVYAATYSKLTALISAKQLDVMIVDEYAFQFCSENDMFLALEEVFSAEQLEALAPYLYESGDQPAKGLRVDESEVADYGLVSYRPVILGIVANSTHTETALEFVEYLFEEND